MDPRTAVTIEFTPSDPGPSATATGTVPPGTPRVELVAGSRAQLSTETQHLLRSRLRAVTALFLLGHLGFYVRNLFLPHDRWGTLGVVVHTGVIVALAGLLALLAGRRPIALPRLRLLELGLFALMTAFFAFMHYRMLELAARSHDAVMVLTAVKNAIIFNVLAIVVYGLFIPNRWPRTAAVVVLMALVPATVAVLVEVRDTRLGQVARPLLTFMNISDNILMLAIAVAVATYGAHVMHTLRVEAYEARQFGQYRLGRRLGAGGMGEVYLAEHQLLKRPCALKLIQPERAGDPRALARFEREVRTTARLTHPNTVEIYDYGRTDDGLFYYVMEYLRGLSLAELVEKHGPLPPGRVIYLLRQACGALSEAHEAGLIHRDLKPANLFASRRGGLYDFVKLLDFGLVKGPAGPSEAALSRDGTIAGSPLYMAPEQATGEREPDRRTDLYALGGVAFYLLTGRPPFEGTNPMQVMIAHARDPARPPSAIRPGVPADLDAVVLRCLAKPPSARFDDAASLERALATCADARSWDADRARAWWLEADRAPAEPEPAPA